MSNPCIGRFYLDTVITPGDLQRVTDAVLDELDAAIRGAVGYYNDTVTKDMTDEEFESYDLLEYSMWTSDHAEFLAEHPYILNDEIKELVEEADALEAALKQVSYMLDQPHGERRTLYRDDVVDEVLFERFCENEGVERGSKVYDLLDLRTVTRWMTEADSSIKRRNLAGHTYWDVGHIG